MDNSLQDPIRSIGLVPDDRTRQLGQRGQQGRQLRTVGTFGGGNGQVQTVAQRVNYGVDFRAEAAAPAAETLGADRTFLGQPPLCGP
jgi:hypothetical protein